MVNDYKIRQIDWNNMNEEGIPIDFLDIMRYFNRHLKLGKYPYVPRTSPITKKELLEAWVPNRKGILSLVAENLSTKRIIAGTTIKLDNENSGTAQITKDSNYKVKGVGTELTKRIIEEGLSKGIEVIVHTSVLNAPIIRIMEKLGYGEGKLVKNFELYRNKIQGSNYDVFRWVIKP